MTISSDQIISEIREIWPTFSSSKILTADAWYQKPKRQEVDDFINNTYLSEYQFTAEVMDCEDFSLILHAFIIQERYKDMQRLGITGEQRLPWAFGQIWLTKYQGNTAGHAQNICLTDDEGIVLIEPQTNEFFVASSTQDVPYHIRI